MPTLPLDDIVNVVAATINYIERDKYTDLALDLQDYIGTRECFKDSRCKQVSGTQIEFKIRTGHANQARNIGLYASVPVNVTDRLVTAQMPFRHCIVPHAIDDIEVSANADKREKIIDIMQETVSQGFADLTEHMEEMVFGKPADSSDESTPHGLFYWLTYNATLGLNGGDPAGFSAGRAGKSSSTYAQWKNYTGQFTNYTDDDIVEKLRYLFRMTNYKNPATQKGAKELHRGNDFMTVSNQDVIEGLYKFLTTRNDNLGVDVTRMNQARGMNIEESDVIINRRPLHWCPFLDSFASDPILGINWGSFTNYIMKGRKFKQLPPRRVDDQPLVTRWYTQVSYNLVCKDLRRNFLLAKSDPVADL